MIGGIGGKTIHRKGEVKEGSRKAVGRQSEESRKAVGRQGRMSNVGRSQGRKESMTGITVNDLGVMGGGMW